MTTVDSTKKTITVGSKAVKSAAEHEKISCSESSIDMPVFPVSVMDDFSQLRSALFAYHHLVEAWALKEDKPADLDTFVYGLRFMSDSIMDGLNSIDSSLRMFRKANFRATGIAGEVS